MDLFNTFYRKHGIRTLANLTNPPLSPVNELILPKAAVAHFIDWQEITIGPFPESPLIKHYDGRIMMDHIGELYEPTGKLRNNRGTTIGRVQREHYTKYRKLRPIHDFSRSARDERTLIVNNYAPLSQLYTYPRALFSNYYRVHNYLKTVFHTVADRLEVSDRQHFIMAAIPKQLVGAKLLKRASTEVEDIPKGLITHFSHLKSMMILEVWKWLGENREFSVLDQIPFDKMDKVNLVWIESGQYTVMNLGRLLSVAGLEVEAEEDDSGSRQIQYRFLRFLIRMSELRSTSDDSIQAAVEEDDEIRKENDGELSDSDLDDISPEVLSKAEAILDEGVKHLDTLDIEDVVGEDEDIEVMWSDRPEDDVDYLKEKIEESAVAGNQSSAQEKRLKTLVEKQTKIKSPYGGDQTLDEFRKITPEDIKLKPEGITIPPLKGVTDKTMLESTLKALDKQYINEVFDKDVVNSAMSVQKAGIIVTDYDAEVVEDASNHYQVVSMRISPIEGDASTISFKLPVIDDNGEFKANGVKYRLRKQRADKPIRKISPRTVSLTSYYAKVFVERSERSVVNYSKWLTNQLMLRSLDPEDMSVTDARTAKAFVNDVKLPRVYTILSTKFRELKINKDLRLFVDYVRREKEFGEDTIKSLEKDGFIVCGMYKRQSVVVDESNVFYSVNNGKYTELGTIESLVGLDISKAPIEIAEFRLFSRNVPVVIALGYRYGLTTLLEKLNVTPRRVPSGTRLELNEDEYVIRFQDESLVFNRYDAKANLILAGLNRYHQSLKRYNVGSFDTKDVYANLMEEHGLRIGFIRELELAMDMYVDPITKDILETLGEPTTLEGLLVRACELLMTDHHPEETDMAEMRIRGYERMAGAVYAEMVKSIRKQRSRGVGTKAKIEMNPEAVWMAVTNQDPSISQVEESNPIQNLKEQELVTFMGTGGRSSRSMVKRTRKYTKSDMGIVSESTPDSMTVGVNAYLTANPQLQDLRGMGKPYVEGETPASAMLSTSALLSPAADTDD